MTDELKALSSGAAGICRTGCWTGSAGEAGRQGHLSGESIRIVTVVWHLLDCEVNHSLMG